MPVFGVKVWLPVPLKVSFFSVVLVQVPVSVTLPVTEMSVPKVQLPKLVRLPFIARVPEPDTAPPAVEKSMVVALKLAATVISISLFNVTVERGLIAPSMVSSCISIPSAAVRESFLAVESESILPLSLRIIDFVMSN